MSLNKSKVEDAVLEYFGNLDYAVRRGLHLATGELAVKLEWFFEMVQVETLGKWLSGLDDKRRSNNYRMTRQNHEHESPVSTSAQTLHL
jgi:hypothetical protein